MKTIFLFIAFVLCIFASIGCRKTAVNNVPAANFTGCRVARIATVTNNKDTSLSYVFQYDDKGRVHSIAMAQGEWYLATISYFDDHIVVMRTANSAQSSRDSLVLDAAGRIIAIDHHAYWGSPGPNIDWVQYYYDKYGNMTLRTVHDYSRISTTNYYWKDGDLIQYSSGTALFTMFYDTTLLNTGNITASVEEYKQYGFPIFHSRHLRTMRVTDGADTTRYFYQRDSSGRLTSTWQGDPSQGNFSKTVIIYECK